MPLLRSLTLALVLLATGTSTATVHAATAPGRITFAVDPLAPERTVDADGATSAVALPSGGVVLAGDGRGGVDVAQLSAQGRLDPAFADGGLARVELPGLEFRMLDLLRRPDGRLVLVGTGRAESRFETPRLMAVGLTAAGALDPAFGQGGVARPGVQTGCGSCAPAALAPDGSLVLTGATGSAGPGTARDRRWTVTRLTPAGAVDERFGVKAVPGTGPGDASGYGAAVAADGRVTLLGTQGRRPIVARLRADGSPDPAFNGGTPQTSPVSGLELSVGPDDVTTVLGFDAVGRLTADGRPDARFGGDGSVELPGRSFARLLRDGRGDGDVLVFSPQTFEPRPARDPAIVIDRIDAAGGTTTTRVALGFGGGFASFFRSRSRVVLAPPLAQNAFTIGDLVARPDGSYVATGGVRVVQYAGEGVGRSTAPFAAAGLTRELAVDPAFGGAEVGSSASLRAVRQRARSTYELRGVAVRVTATDPGLVRIRVADRAGRTLSLGVQPVYRPGAATVRVPLTRRGLAALRRGRPAGVRITARYRDTLGRERTLRAVRATLR